MEEVNDPYKTLGISHESTQTEVRKAFRRLSLKYHPDSDHRSSEANVKLFQKITEAYSLIDTEEKRKAYDVKHPQKSPNPLRSTTGEHLSQQQLIQMFMNGMGAVQQGVEERNTNVQRMDYQIELTLRQCFYGCEYPLAIERTVHRVDNDGCIVKEKEKETIYVSIQAGIDDGEVIIVKEKGHVDSKGKKGDIRVKINVINDTELTRQGLDLRLKKVLSLKEALCGFELPVRHVSGKTYNIKRNTVIPFGFEQRIPSLGMKRGEHVGSLIIYFEIELPTELTEKQKEILRETL
jgi:curved DNA-binding protein